MEKQQKILEMAKDICRVKLNCNDVCNPISACDALKYAERAVEAGYRKQSGWISVDERLPEYDERVLVYLDSKRSYTKIDTDRIVRGRGVRWGNDITHWMPLPEAPKMKGGGKE